MTIPTTDIFVFGTVAAIGLIAYFAVRSSGPSVSVQRWANDNGFRILHSEVRCLFKGPFTWKISHHGQAVYHIRVRDLQGRERSGWLRCMNISLFEDDKTEVIWEDQS